MGESGINQLKILYAVFNNKAEKFHQLNEEQHNQPRQKTPTPGLREMAPYPRVSEYPASALPVNTRPTIIEDIFKHNKAQC